MTHSTWKSGPQFSSHMWKILNRRCTYSFRNHPDYATMTPPPLSRQISASTHCRLTAKDPTKAEESRRHHGCISTQKFGIFEVWMFLCQVVTLFFVKSPAYLTHSLIPGGAAWWDLPCCERQKSPANLAASWCALLKDSSAVLPCNSFRIT